VSQHLRPPAVARTILYHSLLPPTIPAQRGRCIDHTSPRATDHAFCFCHTHTHTPAHIHRTRSAEMRCCAPGLPLRPHATLPAWARRLESLVSTVSADTYDFLRFASKGGRGPLWFCFLRRGEALLKTVCLVLSACLLALPLSASLTHKNRYLNQLDPASGVPHKDRIAPALLWATCGRGPQGWKVSRSGWTRLQCLLGRLCLFYMQATNMERLVKGLLVECLLSKMRLIVCTSYWKPRFGLIRQLISLRQTAY
jgi:hypothetical protein